jgi:hypothetical protein
MTLFLAILFLVVISAWLITVIIIHPLYERQDYKWLQEIDEKINNYTNRIDKSPDELLKLKKELVEIKAKMHTKYIIQQVADKISIL